MVKFLEGKVENNDRVVIHIAVNDFLEIFTRNFGRLKNSIKSINRIHVLDYKRLAFLGNPIPGEKKTIKFVNSGSDGTIKIECGSNRLWFFEITYEVMCDSPMCDIPVTIRDPEVVELTSSNILTNNPLCTFTMAMINMEGLRNVWQNPHPKGWDDDTSKQWNSEEGAFERELQSEFAGEFGAEEPCDIKKPTILMKPIVGYAKKGTLPTKSREGDTGYDLYVLFDRAIPPGRTIDIPTGFEVKIPDGYWGSIKARSSTLLRRGLMIMEGVIDQNYTGKLSVLVYNPGNAPVIVEQGERLAQLILIPMVDSVIMETKEELPKTNRGKAAFGSSGK